MCEVGSISVKVLEELYHKIASSDGFELWESNFSGNGCIIRDMKNNIYAYTYNSIDYVIRNRDECTWRQFYQSIK